MPWPLIMVLHEWNKFNYRSSIVPCSYCLKQTVSMNEQCQYMLERLVQLIAQIEIHY
jgi:hypothetical protein